MFLSSTALITVPILHLYCVLDDHGLTWEYLQKIPQLINDPHSSGMDLDQRQL